MIIDFIIEDLMLNSYLQKNFHTLFIAVLYDDILNDKFPKTSTAFEIPLSQVQKYKLQKKGISKNFLTDL